MDLLFEDQALFKFEIADAKSIGIQSHASSDKWVICPQQHHTNQQILLEKILDSIGFENSNLTTVDLEKSDYFPLRHLVRSDHASQILVFGIKPRVLGLPIHLNANHLYRFEGFEIALTSSLEKMSIDLTAKKMFWAFAKTHLLK